jgi:hypothetical protein
MDASSSETPGADESGAFQTTVTLTKDLIATPPPWLDPLVATEAFCAGSKEKVLAVRLADSPLVSPKIKRGFQ